MYNFKRNDMVINVNDKVMYEGELHTVMARLYLLDGICIPVNEDDVMLSLTDEVILDICCDAVGYTVKELRAHNNRPSISAAREAVMTYLRNKYGWSFAHIGAAMRRHHSTVIFDIRRFTDLLDCGDELAVELDKKLKSEEKK